MNTLERQLAERYPHWFRGRRAAVARPLLRGLAQWSRLEHVYGFLDSHAHLTGFALIEAALGFLNLRYTVDQVERRRIPASGRLLIVANHPSGALDALALLHLVGSVRTDVKIVANDLLSQIEGLRELLLPVRILGGKPSAQSLAAIDQALREEQCVIVFPAGEVSRLGARGITDTRWRRGFLRFAMTTTRRCCRCGYRRATRPCSTALRPCPNRWERRCWRARCSSAAGGASPCGWDR